MSYDLTAEQARVLGALLEKEHTTPDYYPLTLNGLVTACNQKSNREPVMQLSDREVIEAIDGLRDLGLAWQVEGDGRVPKYEENLEGKLSLTLQEVAALCVLLLRGPQTIGEIRGRTGRIYPFESTDEVAVTIQTLLDRENGPLVVRLPLQPGRKEARYMHLLSGEIDVAAFVEAPAAAVPAPTGPSRIDQLEERVTELESQLTALRRAFETFRAQFE